MTTPPYPGQPPMPPSELATPETESRWAALASVCFIGWFVGLMLGGFVHNGLGALTPLRTELGTVERIEVQFDRRNTNRSSYVLSGTTDAGTSWRIFDDEAYRVLEREGYPQRVEVGIGEWTGNAERVIGETWAVDQQTTGVRVGLGVVLGLLTIGGLIATVLIAKRRDGLLRASGFAVSYFLVGAWCGARIFAWIQSG